jgi:hypothetical protein
MKDPAKHLLISTGLQPGVGRGSGQSRFSGLADAQNIMGTGKRLKPFRSTHPLITRLKPGANDRKNSPGTKPDAIREVAAFVPEGHSENSPAFQRWVEWFEISESRWDERTLGIRVGIRSSLRDWIVFSPQPSVETLGYCRLSRRDKYLPEFVKGLGACVKSQAEPSSSFSSSSSSSFSGGFEDKDDDENEDDSPSHGFSNSHLATNS